MITGGSLPSLAVFWHPHAEENIKNRIGFIIAGSESSGKSIFYKLIAKTFGVVDVKKTQNSKCYVCYFRDDERKLFKDSWLKLAPWAPWALLLLGALALLGYLFGPLHLYFPVFFISLGLTAAVLYLYFGIGAKEKFLIMLYDRKGEKATAHYLLGGGAESDVPGEAGVVRGPGLFTAGAVSWEPQKYRDPSINFNDYNILWAIITMVAPFDIKNSHFRNILKKFDWNAFAGYPILKKFILVRNYSNLAKRLKEDFKPQNKNEKRMVIVIALTQSDGNYSVSLIEGELSQKSLDFYNEDCKTLQSQGKIILGWDYDYVNHDEGYVPLQVSNADDSGWNIITSQLKDKIFENKKSADENIIELSKALKDLIEKEKTKEGRDDPLVYFCCNDGDFAGEKEEQTYAVLRTMIMKMFKARMFNGDYPYPEYKKAIEKLLNNNAKDKQSNSGQETERKFSASDTQEHNIAD